MSVCWTPGCDNTALWIPVCAPSTDPDFARRWRCRSCCDLLDELADAAVPEGGTSWSDAGDAIRELLALGRAELTARRAVLR